MSADIDPSVIPEDLRRERRWVTWDHRGDKKEPVGRNGSKGWQRPENWLTFEEAVERGPHIGFVIGGGFTGLDFDGCLDPETKELHPSAENILYELAAGCYAEVSPSGTGLKVFGRGSLPGLELHFNGDGTQPKVTKGFTPDGSYFAITGDAINTEGLKDLTPALKIISANYPGGGRGREAEKAPTGTVGRGQQHNALVAEAGSIRRRGHDDEATFAMLRAWADARFDPRPADEDIRDIVQSTRGWTEDPTADPFPLTEQGDAEHFAARFGDRVRFDHRLERWLIFGDHHWLPQTDGEVNRLVIEAIRARQQAAIGNKDRMNWAIRGEARKRQTNLLGLAESVEPLADAGDGWDADPLILGVQNGVLDLQAGVLRTGRPPDRITKVAPVAYDPEARCPRWEQFLGEVFRSEPELIGYVQRCLGYSLTGVITEQVFWILWGTGANGKGTLIETFARHVLGPNDYCWTMPFPTAGWSNAMSEYQKASLDGRRLVLSSEIERRGRLNESLVKTLTGDDTINGRNPYGEPFQFTPIGNFWLRVNDKPVIRDPSHAMWRRVKLIPFLETFAVNTDLPRALAAEAPGILAWAVRGCLDWQRDGLVEPRVVREATDEYRVESDVLAEFYAERCTLDPGARARGGELFTEYNRWHDSRREPTEDRLGLKEFGLRIKKRFGWKDTRQGVVYEGIGLLGVGGTGGDM